VFATHRKPQPHPLDEVIDDLLAALKGFDEDTETYGEAVKQLKTLMDLRARDRGDREPVSRGQMLAVGANVLGILAILGFEKTNVITTKALGFVPKINTNP
jgi:hypothetical protein